MTEPTHVAIETSAILAYLNDEAEAADMTGIVNLAERGRIRLFVSEFAWAEIDRNRCPNPERYDRISSLAESLPTVMRIGSGIIGVHAIGHDNSKEIVCSLPRGLSSEDTEQFLAYCAQGKVEFFVTKDNGFLKEKAQAVHETFNFTVGTPSECAAHLRSSLARPS